MHEPIRESEFLETACGIVYFLGRWDGADTWCIQRRGHEGDRSGQTYNEVEAKALWQECVDGPKCVECWSPIAFDRHYTGREEREALGVCFMCHHWLLRITPVDPKLIAVIDGYRYSISPDAPKGFRGFIGHGGAEFKIRFHDGREVTTHNLWANGRIPTHFLARIPNNADFIKAADVGGYVGAGSAVGAPTLESR